MRKGDLNNIGSSKGKLRHYFREEFFRVEP